MGRGFWGGLMAAGIIMMATLTEAQWGVRQQQRRQQRADGAVRPEDVAGGLSFKDLQKLAKMQEDGKDLKPAFEHLMPDLGNWDAAEMTKIMDQAMQSPEFQELLNDPEKLQEAIHSNPLINGMPMMKQLFDSPEFRDPEKLKAMFEEGMEQIKDLTSTVADILADPEKSEAVMKELEKDMSPEEKERWDRMMSGDPTAIEEAAEKVSEMLEAAGAEIRKTFDDPEKMEEARQRVLNQDIKIEDPKFRDAAADPAKWKELMKENAKLLFAKLDDEEKVGIPPLGKGAKRKDEL